MPKDRPTPAGLRSAIEVEADRLRRGWMAVSVGEGCADTDGKLAGNPDVVGAVGSVLESGGGWILGSGVRFVVDRFSGIALPGTAADSSASAERGVGGPNGLVLRFGVVAFGIGVCNAETAVRAASGGIGASATDFGVVTLRMAAAGGGGAKISCAATGGNRVATTACGEGSTARTEVGMASDWVGSGAMWAVADSPARRAMAGTVPTGAGAFSCGTGCKAWSGARGNIEAETPAAVASGRDRSDGSGTGTST